MNNIINPELDTYYLIGCRPVNRLIWINRMGKLYRYNVEEREFEVDDIGEWKYYERIVLQSSKEPSILISIILQKHREYNIKEALNLVKEIIGLPFFLLSITWLACKLKFYYPLKRYFKK